MEEKGFLSTEITKKRRPPFKNRKINKKRTGNFQEDRQIQKHPQKKLSENLTEKERATLIKLLSKVQKAVSEIIMQQ